MTTNTIQQEATAATAPKVVPAYLRQKNAAAYCGLSEQMLIKLHRMGTGPARIRKGQAVLYSKAALEEWMEGDQELV